MISKYCLESFSKTETVTTIPKVVLTLLGISSDNFLALEIPIISPLSLTPM